MKLLNRVPVLAGHCSVDLWIAKCQLAFHIPHVTAVVQSCQTGLKANPRESPNKVNEVSQHRKNSQKAAKCEI